MMIEVGVNMLLERDTGVEAGETLTALTTCLPYQSFYVLSTDNFAALIIR